MFLINFSYEPSDVKEIISTLREEEFKDTEIVDFTATVSKDLNARVFYPSDFDSTNEIHQAAIQDYINEMGLLSRCYEKGENKNVRSLMLGGLSLYWLTQVSQKNPQDSVLKNFHYFKFLLPKFSLEEKNILVVLPELCLHFQNAITQFLIKQGVKRNAIKFNTTVKSKFSFRILLSYIRVFYKQINQARQQLPKVQKAESCFDDLIFTPYPGGWIENERDIVLSGIEKLSLKNGRNPKYCPIFFDFKSLPTFKNSTKFDQNYFACFPSKVQILTFFKELIASFFQVSNLNFELEHITFVDNTALKYEFNLVLHHKMEYFCNNIWLKNYFDKDRRAFNVFYQDEFFNSGRLISETIRHSKNPNIISYGVQHGLIYEAHTVYLLNDLEINPLDKYEGMPMPSKFIVWGNYFKELFLSYNSLPETYILVAGHLDYIFKRGELLIEPVNETKRPKLLWCTTLKVDVVNMYNNVVRDFAIAHPELDIEIRFHPMVNVKDFVQNELLEEPLKNRFTYSTHAGIFDAIREADIILTSSGSTVFLDSLVEGKMVFSYVNNDYFMGSLGQEEVRQIYDLADMDRAYNDFRQGKETGASLKNLLHLKLDAWNAILSKH